MRKKNKDNSYRIKPAIATKLGLDINPSGKYRLSKEKETQLLTMSQSEGIKRLFFDIENSPYVAYTFQLWNTTIPYEAIIKHSKIICISYKWEGEDKVHRLVWDKNQNDKTLLEKFMPIINKADEVIGHNGDRFDIRVVRTRCIFHRVPMFPTYRTLDTLKKARQFFKFPNNKLDTILQYLGLGTKLKHSGFSMWTRVCEGDPNALTEMGSYCDIDVVRLEDAFLVMQNYIKHNTHVGVANGGYKYQCPNCGSEHTDNIDIKYTAGGTFKRLMQCGTCTYVYEISNSDYRIMLELQSMLNKPRV
jgi:DNA polymerase elongation subunit (family B)/rubredoxin